MSELERITRLSRERTQEGRNAISRRKDDKYVIDLIYLLEQSTVIIEKLSEGKEAVSDDTITIKRMQDIIAAIGDEHLSAFFMAKMTEGMGYPQRKDPERIGRTDIRS